ncbi:DUF6913 domain-containing protein [Flavobacterium sp.]|uniref:DUF6913 domain-containing protein n=1 Tax=Flavobacterium sp. TaxID=239 RepID=UPI003D0AFCF3
MFIKYLKEFSLKKLLKTTLKPVITSNLANKIQKVGILIDESYFFHKNELINELLNQGFKRDNISILVFNDKMNKNNVSETPTFSHKDMNWKGDFSKQSITDFINTPFDLLISYYDMEKTPLLLITHHSKALFKVGFSTIDKRLHHLMINTNAENYKVFVEELTRYLKILNKI